MSIVRIVVYIWQLGCCSLTLIILSFVVFFVSLTVYSRMRMHVDFCRVTNNVKRTILAECNALLASGSDPMKPYSIYGSIGKRCTFRKCRTFTACVTPIHIIYVYRKIMPVVRLGRLAPTRQLLYVVVCCIYKFTA